VYEIKSIPKKMNWAKITEKMRIISIGFFFGAVLIFINKENVEIQGIIISIAAASMLIGIFTNEIVKRKAKIKSN
jgi:hypothetical protein